jgi:hypothetical protein
MPDIGTIIFIFVGCFIVVALEKSEKEDDKLE